MLHHTLGRKIFTNRSIILLTRSNFSNSVNNIQRETLCSSDIDPPLKRYRDSLSVLRALNSCVRPVPEAPDFRLGGDPWLSSVVRSRAQLLAKAKGRLAAKIAARDFFPNDIAGVAKEIPSVDRWLPLQKPDDILNRVAEGSLSNHEAMDRLILLLAPKHAWKLYSEIAPDEKWTSELLHNLLDLLCVTNSGISGDLDTNNLLNDNGWSELPESDEIYFADELNVHFKARQNNADQQTHIKQNKLSNQKQNYDKQSQSQQEEIEELKLDETHQTKQEEYGDNIQNELFNCDDNLNSCGWQLNGPAEQLFLKEKNLFHNSAAYSSMIRGASRYRNPNRALELVKLVWSTTTATPTTKLSSSSMKINLDLTTYGSLIRSLHNLKTVESGNEDVWSIIENILQHVSKSDSSVENVSLFRNILYCLAEVTVKIRKSFFGETNHLKSIPNYVPIGLGLLDELRCLNLKPDLGVMANLLRLIHNTIILTNNPPTSTTNFTNTNIQELSLTEIPNRTYSYSCRIILESFLCELENDFNLTTPTRFNKPYHYEHYWTQDDYTFFPTAMRIAWYEHNLKLGDRINKLLVGDYDKRFLLGTSLNRRNYGQYYCLLMLNRMSNDFDNPSEMIERFHNVYESNRDIILTNDNIIIRLMTNYTNFLNQTINSEKSPYKSKNLNETRQIAYNYLCGLLSDLTDKFQQAVGLPITKSLTDLIKILTEHSHLNPEKSVQISAKILSRLKLLDERINMENSKLQTSDIKINRLKQKCFKPSVIENMIKLTLSSNQVNMDQSILHKKLVVDTIKDWLNYALSHKLISWSWTPKALSILWECDDLFQCEDIWHIMAELSQAPVDSDNQSINSDLLNPILNELEHTLPIYDLSSFENLTHQRIEHLRLVRNKLLSITDDSKIDNSTQNLTQSKQLKSDIVYKESNSNTEGEHTSSSESDSDSDSD